MRIFQCTALMAVLAVASSQYLPGGGLHPPRKHMSDSALHRFLSSVRGGGRGHRELMALTGSASSPAYATIQAAPGPLAGPPPFGAGIGRLPQSVTHVPAPPKIGAFYITPPDRNAPSFYSGGSVLRRPPLLKITELQNARPSFSLLTSETSNRPSGVVHQGPVRIQQAGPSPQGPPQGFRFIQLNNGQLSGPGGPGGIPQQFLGRPPNAPVGLPPQFLTASQSAPNQIPPQFLSSAPNGHPAQFLSANPGGIPANQNTVQTSTSNTGEAGSLQEIIAKAAQQQHAKVLEKEQKAHPNAQITNSQILVPGAGQQPVFLNQFGQPFLAPAILGGQPQQLQGQPQQLQGQPQQLQGQPQQVPAQLISTPQGQFMLIQGPPQQIPLHLRQQQGQPQLNTITGEIPEQLKGQSTNQDQQISLQFLNGGGLHVPQGQSLSFGGPGNGPFGVSPQHFQGFQGGQVFNLPHGLLQGNIAFSGLRGSQGPLNAGNSVFGQPHFALVGNQDSQGFSSQLLGHGGQGQQQEKGAEKEEQPTRPLESASQQVSQSIPPVPLTSGHGHMTAAIMQSQVELNEPIHKL